ncbi:hypothetical protein [Daejeonella sp. H1SJ63]|uniref:hypothetical protein n=1 Tax=Daejeonella sp. H1SJ63 TaxID=3034145 RepID=UPI0023ED350D|nr:hypothetical protein [Daejeonella sp. H1SJ63]
MLPLQPRNEGDVGLLFEKVLGFRFRMSVVEESSGERLKKNFKINFAGVENVSTFAVPNERGIKKHTGGARPKGTKTERFTILQLRERKYKLHREGKAPRSLKKCQ